MTIDPQMPSPIAQPIPTSIGVETQVTPVTTTAGEVEPAPAPTPEPVPEPTVEHSKGMFRKLIGGGFNAVAQIRHQMKHAEALAEAGVELPELPQAGPKGKAYAKFVAQYQAMQAPVAEVAVDAAV